jgi:hypothetical protein
VLILGGGATEAEARKWTDSYESPGRSGPLFFGVNRTAQPAKGYPKVLRSDDLAGLNPGFYIAVMGFCTEDQVKAVLPGLKTIYPGAYAKEVSAVVEPACPRPYLRGLAPGELRKAVKVGDMKLVALTLDGDNRVLLRAVLFDKDDVPLAIAYTADERRNDIDVAGRLSAKVAGKKIVLDVIAEGEPLSCSGNTYYTHDRYTVSADGNYADIQYREVASKKVPHCD